MVGFEEKNRGKIIYLDKLLKNMNQPVWKWELELHTLKGKIRYVFLSKKDKRRIKRYVAGLRRTKRINKLYDKLVLSKKVEVLRDLLLGKGKYSYKKEIKSSYEGYKPGLELFMLYSEKFFKDDSHEGYHRLSHFRMAVSEEDKFKDIRKEVAKKVILLLFKERTNLAGFLITRINFCWYPQRYADSDYFIKQAINNGELGNYLFGTNGYAYIAPGKMDTDSSLERLEEYYKKTKNDEKNIINEQLKSIFGKKINQMEYSDITQKFTKKLLYKLYPNAKVN